MDDDIINVFGSIELMRPQDDVDQMLEGCQCSVEAKGVNPLLPVACGGAEGYFWLEAGVEGHMPVAFGEIRG